MNDADRYRSHQAQELMRKAGYAPADPANPEGAWVPGPTALRLRTAVPPLKAKPHAALGVWNALHRSSAPLRLPGSVPKETKR